MIWCTELNSKVTTLIYQVSQMSPSKTSASQPQQRENKQNYENSWNQAGQPIEPESLNLYGHTGMFPVNLGHMKDLSINKIVLLFPPFYAQASSTNYMQLTVALISPFATLVIPFSGLVYSLKLKTCVQTAPHVHSTRNSIR